MLLFSSRGRHTRLQGDWSSDVCSSDLEVVGYDKLTKVRDITGTVYDASGKVIKRLKNSEIYDQSEIGRASCRERRLKAVEDVRLSEMGGEGWRRLVSLDETSTEHAGVV